MTRNHKRFTAAAGALELTSRGLDRDTRLLIQLRASFLNNCAFCIDMHTREARKHGWDDPRIDLLRDTAPGAWDSTDLLLQFVDIGVRLSEVEPTERDRVQEEVVARFGPDTTGQIITAIVAINMWNRISVLSQK